MQLTINITNKAVYKALVEFLKSLNIEIIKTDETFDNEKDEMYLLSKNNLSKAYSNDEPEYNLGMVNEPNPSYEKE
ncbi:MAG: hypothetical protein WCO37_05380 [Bacteroidota bacterium]|jgi:hypothetical protein